MVIAAIIFESFLKYKGKFNNIIPYCTKTVVLRKNDKCKDPTFLTFLTFVIDQGLSSLSSKSTPVRCTCETVN